MIHAERLSFSYRQDGRETPVLRGVDLRIARGEMVAITGASGSGKSTLFYLLGGLARPTSGRIVVDGHDLSELSDESLAAFRNRRLGFVFQQFHLMARSSLRDNIALPGVYAGMNRQDAIERVEYLAKALGIDERLSHAPNELSGGQQQRAAIARALFHDVDLVLADEPTGNLDSRSARDVIALLADLSRQGKTVVIITHDPDVAAACSRRVVLRDGVVVEGGGAATAPGTRAHETSPKTSLPVASSSWVDTVARPAFSNLARNKGKSLLTMLGVILGIAAVLSVMTLGEYARNRIMEGYEAMGVNRLSISAWENWRNTKPISGPVYRGFDPETDLQGFRRVFPQIRAISPLLRSHGGKAFYGGRSTSDKTEIVGVGAHYAFISSIQFASGRFFTPYHVDGRDRVCVLGDKAARALTEGKFDLVGRRLSLTINKKTGSDCFVVGVMRPIKSVNQWFVPDEQIILPWSALRPLLESWSSSVRTMVLKAARPADVEPLGARLKALIEQRYGDTAVVSVDNDATMISQMKRFLAIFAALLSGVAFLALLVGGIGINNMMMVSVTDRLKEIGLRKALGATDRSIQRMVLAESVALCGAAGIVGVLVGFGACAGAMVAATKLLPQVTYEFVVDPWAIAVSFGAIVATGIASGMIPAARARRLSIIEALRAE